MSSEIPTNDGQKRTGAVLVFAVLVFAIIEAGLIWSAASNPQGMIGGIFIAGAARPLMARALPVVFGTFLSLLFAVFFAWQFPATRTAFQSSKKMFPPSWLIVFLLMGTGLGLAAVWVLRAFPISTDEYDYLFQAQTLLAGKFYVATPPLVELFLPAHIIVKAGKWVSQYQPGWPLMLAAIFKIGLPYWLMAPLCGGGMLATLAALSARENGKGAAIIAVICIGLSPFFIFNAGSYYTHIPAGFFGLLFCYFGVKYLDDGDGWAAFWAGVAIGAVGLIRTFDVFVFILPFAVEFLRKARRAHYLRLPLLMLGGAPFLAILMYYNYDITGNPLTQVIQWGTTMRVGLHPEDENGHIFGLMDAVRITFLRFGEFFEWTSPAFMLMYVVAFCVKAVKRQLRFYDFILPVIAIAYMAFPSSAGLRFGPRYYFAAYPFMAVTIGWLFMRLFAEPTRLKKPMMGLAVAHIATCLVGLVILSHFLRIVVNERRDLFDQVERAGLHHAVVLIRTGTYGVYSNSAVGEMLRDGIDLNGDIIYSREDETRMNDLKSLFPDRPFYIYAWPDGAKEGLLSPLGQG